LAVTKWMSKLVKRGTGDIGALELQPQLKRTANKVTLKVEVANDDQRSSRLQLLHYNL